jgi:3-oxoacyl-[acyl-carrier protein] reductase
MIDQKTGNIINIASAISAFPQNPAYGASKAGIIHFTKTCEVELAKYNIRVNCIAPGEIATQGVAALLGGSFLAINNQIPMGRMGQSEEIAGGVIYLASKASTDVTGQTIIIDGGELIKPSIIPPEEFMSQSA